MAAMVALKGALFALLMVAFTAERIAAQLPIPPRYDGFVYKDRVKANSVLVEAFFDPLCPDSRDSWWPLKEVLSFYDDKITFIVHPFALPYHYNSFIACRSLHIANRINTSYTYPLLDHFFKLQALPASASAPASRSRFRFQVTLLGAILEELLWMFMGQLSLERFYNKATLQVAPASIIDQIIHFALETSGNSSLTGFESAFQDTATDMATRISFKYGCSRAVTGTPYFFVNGIPLLNSDEILDYNKWKSIVDPLLAMDAEVSYRK